MSFILEEQRHEKANYQSVVGCVGYSEFGLGTTIWSPLASGVLTGKYNKGIPQGSRLANVGWLKGVMERDGFLNNETIGKIEGLMKIADGLDCTVAQLALAWCLKNKHVSSVITGASKVEQVHENMKAIEFADSFTPEVMAEIERIFGVV